MKEHMMLQLCFVTQGSGLSPEMNNARLTQREQKTPKLTGREIRKERRI